MGKNILTQIKSFTFVEILVVLGIVSLALPALFAIIFSIFQQEARIYALKDIMQQGDYAMQNMKFTIQQKASQIVDENYQNDICPLLTSPTPLPAPQINMVDETQTGFTYFIDEADKIASESYQLNPSSIIGVRSYLTNSRVKVSNPGFYCYKTNSFSPPVVVVSFDVSNSALNITLPYRTSFKLRSY